MQIMSLYFFSLCIVLILISCTYDNTPQECTKTDQIIGIRIISTTRINEIKVTKNNEILCSNNYELLFVKKDNDSLYSPSDIDSINNLGNSIWFISIGCNIKYDHDIRSNQVSLQISKKNETSSLDLNNFLVEKKIINVFSEQDTAWLFSYSNPTISTNPDYDFSAFTLMNCHDGYCFASLPITDNEYCFDK
jgi:hypothetical protein